MVKKRTTGAKDKIDARAVWLWGQLRDFESEGVLDMDPNELFAKMTDNMKASTHETAPRVAAWLERLRQHEEPAP